MAPTTLTRLMANSTAPRITCYDDLPGPTHGERIELSARVLGNWVNKAANLAQEEWDLGPSESLGLCGPAHWRVVYWTWAAWACGAAVDLRRDPQAVTGALPWAAVVSTEAQPTLTQWPGALLTRASLARAATAPVPPEWLDEAAEVASYPDHFDPSTQPDPSDPALLTPEGAITFADLMPWASSGRTLRPQARIALATNDPLVLVRAALCAFAVEGSLVLSAGGADQPGVSGGHDDGGHDNDSRHDDGWHDSRAEYGTPPQRALAEGVTDDWLS